MFRSIFVFLACLSQSPSSDKSTDDLCLMVRASQREMASLECEYEGTIVFTKEIMKTADDVLARDFTGVFLRRDDGATLSDCFERDSRSGSSDLTRKTVTRIHGRQEVFARAVERPKSGTGEVSKADFFSGFVMGSRSPV